MGAKKRNTALAPSKWFGSGEEGFLSSTSKEDTYLSPELLQKRAELAAFSSNLSAALTKQAMDNTAMLATVEAKCIEIAPHASEEYRKILAAYVYREAMKIAGGEW